MDAIGLQSVTLPKVTLPKMALDGYRESDMGYIRNGLVFHLDGINKGGVEGKWTDLIGGVEFTPKGNVTFGESFVNGNLIASIPIQYPYNSGSIEVTYRLTNTLTANGILLYPGDSNANIAIGITANNPRVLLSTTPSYGTSYRIANTIGDHVISGTNNSPVVFDFDNAPLFATNDYWAANRGNNAQINIHSQPIDIYSIRIYDRILAEDEMRHNQRVDIKRFGLKIQPPVMTLQDDWEDEYVPSGQGV